MATSEHINGFIELYKNEMHLLCLINVSWSFNEDKSLL